jgi:hypothetical protein
MVKHIQEMRGNRVQKIQVKFVGNAIDTTLFFFVSKWADLISRMEIGAVRFGAGLQQSLTSPRNSVPASMSEEGWFLKIDVKCEIISLETYSLEVRTLPSGAMIFSKLHLPKLSLARLTWNMFAFFVSGQSKQRQRIPKSLSVLSSYDFEYFLNSWEATQSKGSICEIS